MPVEIRELIIKATVADNTGTGVQGSPSYNKEELVAACVEQVMEILKDKKER